MNHRNAVLFISFGGPEKREDVMPFLETVTRGRGVPPARLVEVAHHYDVIGGASPLNEITRRQAEALRKELDRAGARLPVFVAQRNWPPFIEDTLRRMAAEGIHRAVGFITAAHRSEASHDRYIAAVEEARRRIGPGAPVIDYVDPWFDHPLFIGAMARHVEEALRNIPAQEPQALSWIFTAHSIPTPMARASRYVEELNRTAELIAKKFGVESWTLAYTSRSGRPTDPWLEPDVCEVIRSQAPGGPRGVLAVPIGFVADHVEVLFDLDVEAREAARKAGVAFYRSATVGDHPDFVQMMADVIQKKTLSRI